MITQRYQKKEFCIAMNCPRLMKRSLKCKTKSCIYSAKQFHHWLNENDFCIAKCIKSI